MAKRFGRNQKRKLKLHIEALQAEVDMTNRSYRGLLRELSILKDEMLQARRMLGQNSAILPPESIYMDGEPRDLHIKMTKPFDFRSTAYQSPTMELVPLTALITDAAIAKHSGALHLTAWFGDKKFAYAVSETALKSTPKDVLAIRIAQVMSTQISNELKALYG